MVALPKQSEDFPNWYQETVRRAEMAEMSPVRGSMVIRPYGYAIWERVQQSLDSRIKATGHENLYFPLLIPYKLLEKEAEHVEGFSPQVAVVTHAGGEKLEEPYVVRPTSETIIWATYKKWVQSYRDLPLLYNQWANVVRWELRPRIWLRTTEFLWQEGHTAHETSEEAIQETLKILHEVYRASVEEDMSLPVLAGRKSEAQRFPGAAETYAIEGLMRDGKSLQAGTSHYFAQNFSKAYEVRFLGRDGKEEHPFSTSWGASTRLIGGIVMAHGDDKGLRVPPRLAPHQVVIVPIYSSEADRSLVLEFANRIRKSLEGIRIKIDDREQHRPGYKFNEWEVKGVPIRFEMGPREVQASEVVVYRRDTAEKSSMKAEMLEQEVPRLLEDLQRELFKQAMEFRESRTIYPKSYSEMKAFIDDPGGYVITPWCGSRECEDRVKAETKADIRALPIEPTDPGGPCIVCGNKGIDRATWAQSY